MTLSEVAETVDYMFSVVFAIGVLAATLIQAVTSAKEVGRANRSAVDWWNAEDELVAEERWWCRWATRRQLRSWRDQDTADSIRHVHMVLISWLILVVVAVAAFGKASLDWLGTSSP